MYGVCVCMCFFIISSISGQFIYKCWVNFVCFPFSFDFTHFSIAFISSTSVFYLYGVFRMLWNLIRRSYLTQINKVRLLFSVPRQTNVVMHIRMTFHSMRLVKWWKPFEAFSINDYVVEIPFYCVFGFSNIEHYQRIGDIENTFGIGEEEAEEEKKHRSR